MGEGVLGSDLVVIRVSLGTLRDPGDDFLRVVSDAPVLLQKTTQKSYQAKVQSPSYIINTFNRNFNSPKSMLVSD